MSTMTNENPVVIVNKHSLRAIATRSQNVGSVTTVQNQSAEPRLPTQCSVFTSLLSAAHESRSHIGLYTVRSRAAPPPRAVTGERAPIDRVSAAHIAEEPTLILDVSMRRLKYMHMHMFTSPRS